MNLLEVHLGNKELSHEGSDAIVSTAIQELGRIIASCGRIGSLDLIVQYTDGETYESPLTDAKISTIRPFGGEIQTVIKFHKENA